MHEKFLTKARIPYMACIIPKRSFWEAESRFYWPPGIVKQPVIDLKITLLTF